MDPALTTVMGELAQSVAGLCDEAAESLRVERANERLEYWKLNQWKRQIDALVNEVAPFMRGGGVRERTLNHVIEGIQSDLEEMLHGKNVNPPTGSGEIIHEAVGVVSVEDDQELANAAEEYEHFSDAEDEDEEVSADSGWGSDIDGEAEWEDEDEEELPQPAVAPRPGDMVKVREEPKEWRLPEGHNPPDAHFTEEDLANEEADELDDVPPTKPKKEKL